MSRRLLIVAAFVIGLFLASSSVASASDFTGGQGGRHASAGTGAGSVTVAAGIYRHHRSSAPTTTVPATATTTTDPPAPDPGPSYPPPVTCAVVPINLVEFQNLLGIGGPTPGYWGMDQCTGPNGSYAKGAPVWVYDGPPTNGAPDPAAPTPPAGPAPSSATVAKQAASTLTLPSPVIEMAPPQTSEQIVGVRAWLWVNSAAWQPSTVTATVDGVSATATATPTEVVWNMGDGHSVTCDGPGTPYDASQPNATTDCSYTWATPSSSRASGTYQVTATIEFSVTWTAAGAAGGGNLGLVPGAVNAAQVTVGESEALNTNGSA
jgi:hypothetical protein